MTALTTAALDLLYEQLSGGEVKATPTGLQINGVHLKDRYVKLADGSANGFTTNLQMGGVDLNGIFAGIGTTVFIATGFIDVIVEIIPDPPYADEREDWTGYEDNVASSSTIVNSGYNGGTITALIFNEYSGNSGGYASLYLRVESGVQVEADMDSIDITYNGTTRTYSVSDANYQGFNNLGGTGGQWTWNDNSPLTNPFPGPAGLAYSVQINT